MINIPIIEKGKPSIRSIEAVTLYERISSQEFVDLTKLIEEIMK